MSSARRAVDPDPGRGVIPRTIAVVALSVGRNGRVEDVADPSREETGGTMTAGRPAPAPRERGPVRSGATMP